jgi:hypothetical protein
MPYSVDAPFQALIPLFLFIVVPLLVMLGGFWGHYRAARRQRLVQDIPRSKTTGVFIGLVSVSGTGESSKPLQSWLAAIPCLYYSWEVQERWSHTVTETTTDEKGRSQTRTRTESGWTTVAGDTQMAPFYLQDDLGNVLIRPEHATVEADNVFDETCHLGDALYYAKGPSQAVSDSDHVRRFVERAIPLHTELYVIGQARERQDIVAAEIAHDPQAPLFLISVHPRDSVASGYGWHSVLWLAFAALVPFAAGFASYRAQNSPYSTLFLWPLIASGSLYLFLLLASQLLLIYNELVELRQRVRQGWANVDVQLKRRADLIRNLVEVVKGLRDHEANVQQGLVTLRAQLEATAPGQPGPDPAACLPALRLISESYPELKANDSFLALMQSLSDTEQRISLARGYFNEIATAYNTRIQSFPESLVAQTGGFAEQPCLAINDFERAPVKV